MTSSVVSSAPSSSSSFVQSSTAPLKINNTMTSSHPHLQNGAGLAMKDHQHPVSNYAVIKLKPSDSLVSLFQLLLQNGYNQVSFVNSMNETIFPFIAKFDKVTQTQSSVDNAHRNHLLMTSPILSPDLVANLNGFGAGVGVPCRNNFDLKNLGLANLTFEQALNSLAMDLFPNVMTSTSTASSRYGPLASSLPSSTSSALAAAAFLGLPAMPAAIFGNGTASTPIFPPTKPTYGDNIVQNGTSYASSATSDVHGALKRKINENAAMLGMKPPCHDTNGFLASDLILPKKPHLASALPPPHHHHDHQQVVAANGASIVQSALSTATNTQLRQRGQRGGGFADDPSLYVTCRLCKNRIMGSRISNLTNHVRRHSSLKQFQCCYCEYTHNEMAKVRLHMLHNHKDKDSQPIDNLSPEMQTSWELLMKECFPDHSAQAQNGLSTSGSVSSTTGASSNNNGRSSGSGCAATPKASGNIWKQSDDPVTMVTRRHDELQAARHLMMAAYDRPDSLSANKCGGGTMDSSPSDFQINSPNLTPPSNNGASSTDDAAARAAMLLSTTNLPCVDCGELVPCREALEHVYARHLACLPLFVCSQCGFDDNDRDKLKRHLAQDHRSEAEAQILTRNLELILDQLLPQFFPTSAAAALLSLNANSANLLPANNQSIMIEGGDNSKLDNDQPETKNISISASEEQDESDNLVISSSRSPKMVLSSQTQSPAGDSGKNIKDSSTDSDANHSSPDGSVKMDSPEAAADCAKTAKREPPDDDADEEEEQCDGKLPLPYKCPKCRYTSASRRRIVNHANLRHNIDCSGASF